MPEVHGTAYVETAKDKLVALFVALQATMMTNDTIPRISAVHESHVIAALLVDSVTVQLANMEDDPQFFGASKTAIQYRMEFMVRVHTSYRGAAMKADRTARLLNSVANKLRDNVDLADGYFLEGITDFSTAEEFDDSATVGGQFRCLIIKSVTHTQE